MTSAEFQHIEPAELYDFLAGQTSAAREREIRQHLDVCGICQAELALAESFRDQATDTSMDPAIAARLEAGLTGARLRKFGWRVISQRSTWVRTGLLAASLACALLGIHALRGPALRQGQSGDMRAAQPDSVWDLQLNESETGYLRVAWPAVTGASEYEIHLQSSVGEILWSRRTMTSPATITIATLPTAVRAEPFLFVSVAALMADSTLQSTRPHPLPTAGQP
jgi:hypothetical protein